MIEIDDPADPRLADFVGLTDAALRRRFEASQRVFIVEGILAIEALLASTYVVRSILTTPRMYARLEPRVRDIDAPVYVVSDEVMRGTVGFDLHRGAVASAARPAETNPVELISNGTRLVVLEGVNDHENLGAIFRNAAAFGVDGVLLDPTCADPLYRRSVRVSLGHVLAVPFARLPDWPSAIQQIRDAGWSAVALTPSGETDVDELAAASHARIALLLGAEGPGLSPAALGASQHRVRIPLAPGVDSLNVATAAAVALHVLRNHAS